MFSTRKYSQFAITTQPLNQNKKIKILWWVGRALLVLPCAGCCGFPLHNEFFHLCRSETRKTTQCSRLLLFSFLSSHEHGTHTHKRTKLQLVVGQPTAFAALCIIISLESESSSSSVAFAVFISPCLFFHSPPPPKLTC